MRTWAACCHFDNSELATATHISMNDGNGDFSVFVGDLGPEVDDALLETTFRTYYPSTRTAKVMVDVASQRSRGYGFVRFSIEAERDRAVAEMSGVYLGSRPIRVSVATAKRPQANYSTSAGGTSNASASTVVAGAADESANTTLFIGGLSPTVTEAELHAAFLNFGEIVYTKIPQGKGCGCALVSAAAPAAGSGPRCITVKILPVLMSTLLLPCLSWLCVYEYRFVQFLTRAGAEYALSEMNGFVIGGQSIRISWGKSTGKAPPGGGGHGPPQYTSATGYYGAQAYADPYAQAYPMVQGYGPQGFAADPYAAYGTYAAVDPYAAAYAGYSMHPMGPAASNYATLAAAGAASAAAAAHGPGPVHAVLYDPLAPVNYDKLNMGYMHRQLPVLTGTYIRSPSMPAQPSADTPQLLTIDWSSGE
ncbi:hypothetical protein QJQ45_016784 [Haematococcus lacustris]|nr:hypothetical protein QJQ45_016784 [Haematococcus lacustris]